VGRKIIGELVLTEKDGCTMLKLSPQGDKLALGYTSGKIEVFNINQPGNIVLLKSCILHSAAITELIWSEEGQFIKSISRDQLLYLDLLREKEQLVAVFGGKGLQEVEWPECGKFDWKNFHIWNNRLHTVD
jgi:WD40 repeat protein